MRSPSRRRLPRPRSSTPARTAPPHRPGVGIVAALLCLTGAVLSAVGDAERPALAQVVHGQGYQATVLGWTSWYGSYQLGAMGTGWCIDHGLRAPDAAFGYVPTDVGGAPAHVRAAIAWSAARPLEGPVDHAARMLAFHDLMGAQYPFGRLDVDALQPHQMAGFGGTEGAVLARARLLKADGLAHSHLRGPVSMVVDMTEAMPGTPGDIGVRLTDANGHPMGGLTVQVSLTGGERHGDGTAATGPDGWAHVVFTAGTGEVRATAAAVVPSLQLSAWASSTVAAQRIARPDTTRVEASDGYVAAPPTTLPPTTLPPTTLPPTTTTAPSTTTTAPPTTTTAPSTTTTVPPTTTTAPSTTTTAPPTTTTSPPPPPPPPPTAPPTVPPTPALPPATPRVSLPRTGPRDVLGMALVGAGLVLGGAAAVGEARRRRLVATG